jgi:hypothetical protein
MQTLTTDWPIFLMTDGACGTEPKYRPFLGGF